MAVSLAVVVSLAVAVSLPLAAYGPMAPALTGIKIMRLRNSYFDIIDTTT